MLIINFVFFLSFKILCAFYKPKNFCKPADLQDHFEVFDLAICFVFLSSFLCVPDSLSIRWGWSSPTCLHPLPRVRVIIQTSSSVRPSQLQPPSRGEVSWGSSLPPGLLSLVHNFLEAAACPQQFSTLSSHKGRLSTAPAPGFRRPACCRPPSAARLWSSLPCSSPPAPACFLSQRPLQAHVYSLTTVCIVVAFLV